MKANKQDSIPKTKYEVTYVSDDETVHTWYYDKDITTSGPYKVEIKHSKTFINEYKKLSKKK